MRIVIARKGWNKFCKGVFSVLNRALCRMEPSTESYSTEAVAGTEVDYRVKKVRELVPRLTSNLHKGQCGRVGVIGGSFEYTGAPYFAAISALKLGVDLVHVFCCRDAGPVIKSYSPELIVHPFLDFKDVLVEIEPWLEKLHALVVGPGMGRNEDLLENVGNIIKHCKTKMKTPPALIIDADGLYLITKDVDLIKDYGAPVILTPNVVEYSRLALATGESDPSKMAAALNAVLVRKGRVDVIANGTRRGEARPGPDDLGAECDVPGSDRRCGGQGDVLSGCTAAFAAWARLAGGEDRDPGRSTWAAYGGCAVTRICSRMAFEEKGRGMTASDMIPHIHKAFGLRFEV